MGGKSQTSRTTRIIVIAIFSSAIIFGVVVGKMAIDSFQSPAYIVHQISKNDCPIRLAGNTGEITKIAIQDSCLAYYVTFRDNTADFEVLRQNAKIIDDGISICLFMCNGMNKLGADELFDSLEKHKLGIQLNCQKDSGEKFSYSANYEQVHKAYHLLKDKTTATDALSKLLLYNIQLYNQELPQYVDYGLWIDSISVDKDSLFVNFSCDGNNYQINELALISPIDFFDSSEPESLVFISLCKVANNHLVFKWVDKNTKKYTESILPKEKISKIHTNSYIDQQTNNIY